MVKACQDLPGQRLFQYLDDDGQRRAVEAADVNAYIREALGEDFSAKDFRTWAGTVGRPRPDHRPNAPTSRAAKRNVNTCVKAVAGLLGNTAAVARSAYIHPAILGGLRGRQAGPQARQARTAPSSWRSCGSWRRAADVAARSPRLVNHALW